MKKVFDKVFADDLFSLYLGIFRSKLYSLKTTVHFIHVNFTKEIIPHVNKKVAYRCSVVTMLK